MVYITNWASPVSAMAPISDPTPLRRASSLSERKGLAADHDSARRRSGGSDSGSTK